MIDGMTDRSTSPNRAGALVALCGMIAALPTQTVHATPRAASNEKDIRYVVFHRPGPAWLAGKTMFEQPGVRAHVEHYRRWLDADQSSNWAVRTWTRLAAE